MKAHFQSRLSARVLALACLLAATVLVSLAAPAQTFKVIYTFKGSPDGGSPLAGVTLDSAGNLYGTTYWGGASGCADGAGCGTVFELTHGSGGWTESVLYTFTGGADGANPGDALIFDKTGSLYGTTEGGGAEACPDGCGVAFELTPGSGDWTETVLYSFQGGTDGYYPIAALVFDKQGHLYSTLSNGGRYGGGSVYQLTKGTSGWKKRILYSSDGGEPQAALILDAAGNLYSTTPLGGSGGTVFELMHGSWKEKTLYAFTGPGGAKTEAGLVFDEAGNLYGTTEIGGKYDKGVVFKLAPGANGKWKETVLHSFKGGSDGDEPFSTPVFDKAGSLYGTTSFGGDSSCNPPYGCGTVFKLTPGSGGWKETVLHRFSGGRDGSGPFLETLALDAEGNIYGTTEFGGNAGCFQNGGCGVVFEITP